MSGSKRAAITSGKTTRESSCNALPLAYHNSSHYVSNNDDLNRESIIDKIIADKFSFTLVLLSCFSAFLANIVASINKLPASTHCSWQDASIIGPMDRYNCPFPISNSVLRISISCYLICFLIIVIIILTNYKNYHCFQNLSFTQCIACTITVLSLSHYLCFISIIMDSYSIYTALKFSQYEMDKQLRVKTKSSFSFQFPCIILKKKKTTETING